MTADAPTTANASPAHDIRPATVADYDAANALYQTTMGENFALDRSLWEAVCADGERYRPLIARDVDGSPMGLAVVVVSDRVRLSAGTRRSRFHVDNLIVSPHHRRKGVGRALLEEIKTLARAKAPSYILINCDFMNVAARRTYESAGLSVTRESGDRFEIAFAA